MGVLVNTLFERNRVDKERQPVVFFVTAISYDFPGEVKLQIKMPNNDDIVTSLCHLLAH